MRLTAPAAAQPARPDREPRCRRRSGTDAPPGRRPVRAHALGGRAHRLQHLRLLLVLHGVEIVEPDARGETLRTVGRSAQLHHHRDHPVVGAHVAGALDVVIGAQLAVAVGTGGHIERLHDRKEHVIGPQRRGTALRRKSRGSCGRGLLLLQLHFDLRIELRLDLRRDGRRRRGGRWRGGRWRGFLRLRSRGIGRGSRIDIVRGPGLRFGAAAGST